MAHDHHHHHDHHDHVHGHGADAGPAAAETPLDPAQQSLADALRASFRVLKAVMLLLVVLFLCTGVFTVDQKEVAVVSTFGRRDNLVRPPGLHFAWPFPIDEVIKIPTAPISMDIDAFWLRLSEQDKSRELSELGSKTLGLDPATDGALLTGDRAIMHMRLNVQYRISEPMDYVDNVSDERALLEAVVRNAAVAEAARTTADVVWKDPGRVAAAVQRRAQATLERLRSGITIENVAADKSYFPLQAKDAFLNVTDAENAKINAINAARSTRNKKLNGAAGEAWEDLAREIERLDQAEDGPARDAIVQTIGDILLSRAKGEAGGRIQLAKSRRDKIIADAQAEVRLFEMLLEEYRRNPDLLRRRLRQNALNNLYAETGVTKWLLPEGAKQLVLWLSKDPVQIEAEEKAAQAKRREQKP